MDSNGVVSTHSHPKVAANELTLAHLKSLVSTHSHPKVAACNSYWVWFSWICFNTQPPEGGCNARVIGLPQVLRFQHTATRRWLRHLAGEMCKPVMFQHTATRRWLHIPIRAPLPKCGVSTHSHPKVAASPVAMTTSATKTFQHTATRRWLLPRVRHYRK